MQMVVMPGMSSSADPVLLVAHRMLPFYNLLALPTWKRITQQNVMTAGELLREQHFPRKFCQAKDSNPLDTQQDLLQSAPYCWLQQILKQQLRPAAARQCPPNAC